MASCGPVGERAACFGLLSASACVVWAGRGYGVPVLRGLGFRGAIEMHVTQERIFVSDLDSSLTMLSGRYQGYYVIHHSASLRHGALRSNNNDIML